MRKPPKKRRVLRPAAREREVLFLGEREIDVQRRPYRRTLGITLKVNGRICVSAPVSTPLARIEDFVCANRAWIAKHALKYETVRARFPRKRYIEGEFFPLLGQSLRLVYRPGLETKPVVEPCADLLIIFVPRVMWGDFDPSRPHPEMAKPVAAFFAQCARVILQARLEHFSMRMGLKPTAVSYRAQKTRWGSCSTRGRISLNWRLIIAPREVIDYVIVHELAHLHHYNHSAAFWRLVGTEVRNYAEHRDWLRVHQFDSDFLAKRSELHDEL